MKIACDKPAASENVAYYTIAGLPGNPQSPISTNPLYGVEYDLAGVPAGTYTVQVAACNDQQCSLPAPLTFTIKPRPSSPAGLKTL